MRIISIFFLLFISIHNLLGQENCDVILKDRCYKISDCYLDIKPPNIGSGWMQLYEPWGARAGLPVSSVNRGWVIRRVPEEYKDVFLPGDVILRINTCSPWSKSIIEDKVNKNENLFIVDYMALKPKKITRYINEILVLRDGEKVFVDLTKYKKK
ncbi:MAG: hypothetical protein KDK36_01235 [Leptospiraceae bacterium]|nr:hypothetical protein [Leptospiraceae bacterium]